MPLSCEEIGEALQKSDTTQLERVGNQARLFNELPKLIQDIIGKNRMQVLGIPQEMARAMTPHDAWVACGNAIIRKIKEMGAII